MSDGAKCPVACSTPSDQPQGRPGDRISTAGDVVQIVSGSWLSAMLTTSDVSNRRAAFDHVLWHRWTVEQYVYVVHSLSNISQCRSSWRRWDRPRSLLVSLRMPAAPFSTRWSLSVMNLGVAARIALYSSLRATSRRRDLMWCWLGVEWTSSELASLHVSRRSLLHSLYATVNSNARRCFGYVWAKLMRKTRSIDYVPIPCDSKPLPLGRRVS